MQSVIPAVIVGASVPVYTRNGDFGGTSIGGGVPLRKSAQLLSIIGTLDELNASLGVASSTKHAFLIDYITEIQRDLFTLGSFAAGIKVPFDVAGKVSKMEDAIDSLESEMPELTNFILPTGDIAASYLQLSRAICRRLEREIVKYLDESASKDKLDASILKYINRLSDLLFVLARYVNFKLGSSELLWKIND